MADSQNFFSEKPNETSTNLIPKKKIIFTFTFVIKQGLLISA